MMKTLGVPVERNGPLVPSPPVPPEEQQGETDLFACNTNFVVKFNSACNCTNSEHEPFQAETIHTIS